MNDNKNLFQEYLIKDRLKAIASYQRDISAPEVDPYLEDLVWVGSTDSRYEQEYEKTDDSPIPSVADLWRLANVQGHSVNLSKKEEELFSSEATWLPQIEKAKTYVDAALLLNDYNNTDTSNYSESLLSSLNEEKQRLQQLLSQLDPEIKLIARYNPYLRDIFYETRSSNTRGRLGFAAQAQIALRDFRNDNLFTDWNFTNNLENAISTKDGAGGSLSQETLDILYNLKTNLLDPNKLSKQLESVNSALNDAKINYDRKSKDLLEKVNTINKGNFLFDPTKVNPKVKKAFEDNELEASNPKTWLYSIPHIGSSYSELGATIANVTASSAMNYLAKGALTAAAAGTTVMSGGATLPLLFAATELGVNFAIQNYSRDSETKSEMFDNFQEAVTKNLERGDVTITNELNAAYNVLRNMGYDVDKMDDQQKFGLLIAHRIPFSDPEANKAIEDARNGLNVLSQTNSGLQLLDLAEAGLYNYGGRYLKQAFKLNKSGQRFVTPIVSNNYLSNPASTSLYNKATDVITDKLTKAITLGSGNAIKNIAGRRIIEGVGSFAKKLLMTSFMESQEEGIQYLVGQRYQKGDYKNVDNYSFLDGVANGALLGFEARAAYYGLHPDDALNTDSELRKNMDIGAFTGLFMNSVYAAPGVVRGVQQLSTDRKLQELAANGYENAENDAKIEAFLNASTKRFKKGSYRRIADTLERLRETKPDEVTEDMIKADMLLLNDVFGVDNSEVTHSIAKDLKMNRNSDLYASFVKNAIHLKNRYNDALTAANEANRVIDEDIRALKDYLIELQYFVENEKPLKEQADFQQLWLAKTLNKIRQQALSQLYSELKERQSDLQRLANDRNLNVNLEGIEGMLEFVEKQISQAKEASAKFSSVLSILPAPNEDKIINDIIAYTINQAVAINLKDHYTAYRLGLYSGTMEGVKPTWGNITEAHRNSIIEDEANEALLEGRDPLSREEIIKKYNKEVEDKWLQDEDKADKYGVSRKRALAIITRDLNRRVSLEDTARREQLQDRGDVVDENSGEPVPSTTEDTEIPDSTLPSETTETVEEAVIPERGTDIDSPTPVSIPTPPIDSMLEADGLDLQQAAIDALNQQLGRDESDITYTDDNPDVSILDGMEEDREQIARELQDGVESGEAADESFKEEVSNNLAAQELQDTTPIPTPLNEIEDSAQTTNIEDLVNQTDEESAPFNLDLQPTTPEQHIDPESLVDNTSDGNEIPTPPVQQEEAPEASTTISTKPEQTATFIQEPNTVDPVTVEEVIADPNQIVIDGDNIGMSFIGNEEDVQSVDPNAVAAESYFEDNYNQGLTQSSSAIQNEEGYAKHTKGIDNSSKQKQNLIGKTFFYRPDADEPLLLKANGEEVLFTTKDGKKAERATGKQLAEKLAIPGWLASADDTYYIVTDKWSADRREGFRNDPISDLAIHLVIEKDGVVYVASLRTVARAKYELDQLGVAKDKADQDIQNLIKLRTRIIESYCSNYKNEPVLPSKPKKSVKPVNLRISNGTIRNEKLGILPKFRKLTEVPDLEITSDPHELTEKLESGEIEIGYGKGAFTMTNPFGIMRINGDGYTSTLAFGYAGKLYLVPRKHQVPSLSFTPPIMLSEELHDIPGLTHPDATKDNGDPVLPLTYNAKHELVGDVSTMTEAELIYELLTDSSSGSEISEWMLTLLANHGPKTTTEFDSRQELDHYVRKNLSTFVTGDGITMLAVGMARSNSKTGREGKHVVKRYRLDTISNAVRKQIIFNIAKNTHWNTDKDFLMTRIPDFVVKHVLLIVKNRLASGNFKKGDHVFFRAFALPFTLEDVGYTLNDNNEIVKLREGLPAPSVLAWMINHGKIKTDLGDHIFENPFVYADDVRVEEPSIEAVQEAKEKGLTTKKSVEDVEVVEKNGVFTFTQYGISRRTGKRARITNGGKTILISDILLNYASEDPNDSSIYSRGIREAKALKLKELRIDKKTGRHGATIVVVELDNTTYTLDVHLTDEAINTYTALSNLDTTSQTTSTEAKTTDNSANNESVIATDEGPVIQTNIKGMPNGVTGIVYSLDQELPKVLFTGENGKQYLIVFKAGKGKVTPYIYIKYDNGSYYLNNDNVEEGGDNLTKSLMSAVALKYTPKKLWDYIMSGQAEKDNDDDVRNGGNKLNQFLYDNFSIKYTGWGEMEQVKSVLDTTEVKIDNSVNIGKQPIKPTPENLSKYGLTMPEGKPMNGFVWAIGFDKKTGNPNVFQLPKGRAKALGVYSKVKGTGKMNVAKAKQWLADKLGIDDVVMTTKVLRTHSDEKAYGVLRVAWDRVRSQFNPRITLSLTAGRGIEYHEAWHYVSLLLLSDADRLLLYQDYVNTHKGSENLSIQEVEELLAEEFRDYMTGFKHIFWNYRIQKMFSKIARFLRIDFLNPSLHMLMFASIDHGEFSKMKPSLNQLMEFYKAYDEGVYYYIPGMDKEDYDKIPNISDANTFYNVVQTLSFSTLLALNIRTKEDLLKGLKLSTIFDQLETSLNNGGVDPMYESIAEDVLLNRPLFEKYIKDYLQQLDIDKHIEDARANEQEDNDRLDAETGSPENTWDKTQGEESKRDNASKNAKLFFFSIPDSKYTYVEDELTGQLKREVEEVTDPIFGLTQPVSFAIAWNKVLEGLWNCENIDAIIARCYELGETDPFYLLIYNRLTDKDNPLPEQVVTLLENTIKSSKNSMNTISIHPDKPVIYEGMTEELKQLEMEAASKRMIWEVLDSDNLRKIARYPKTWSLAFFASDNVLTNSDGSRSINHSGYEFIKQLDAQITNVFNEALKNKKIDRNVAYNDAKRKFIELCNSMMIPLDSSSFDYLISKLSGVDSKGKVLDNFSKFRLFWNTDKKGSFRSILSNIYAHATPGNKKKLRLLDRMFTTSIADAHINLIAVAYGKTHPSPEEFSVTGADGSLIYPISENNYMSDQVRWLNQDLHGKKQNILTTAYGKSSLLAKSAGALKLKTLIAVNDQQSDSSRDYFGISPIEDYIAKLVLTEKDQLTLPTMSDKKTWYSIEGVNISNTHTGLFHEVLARVGVVDVIDETTGAHSQQSQIIDRQLSEDVINTFFNYFLSELDSVMEYYKNKAFVEQNPEYWRQNYHGKIKKGKMAAGGHGGRFRYFSRLQYSGSLHYLNKDLDKLERNESNEAVLLYLDNLKNTLLNNGSVTAEGREGIQQYIFSCVNTEINKLVGLGIIKRNSIGLLTNVLIPSNILKRYRLATQKLNHKEYKYVDKESDAIYSLIASHVMNTLISIQEVEKCFTGDPAFYKWAKIETIYKPNDPSFNEIYGNLDEYLSKHPEANREEFATYDTIIERATDKIKRLSSVLSTGTNLRTYWGEGVEHEQENDTSYTVLNLKDNEIYTPYYDTLLLVFRSSLIRETYHKHHPELTDDLLFEKVTVANENEILKEFTKEEVSFVEKQSKLSAKAYFYDPDSKEGINLADAAVYMRPTTWRKVMKAIGKWNDDIEKAYNIMENNDNWMSDPTLYKMATQLILNVQKMVYMGDTFESKLGLDIPVFNKMAIFPLFKTIAKADNRHLYNRMNNEELGVIDMLVFESAVKVGAGNTVRIYKDGYLNELNLEELNKPSFTKYKLKGNLPTLTLDLKNLRLQLNTDPHEHTDRAMGTQAVKMFLANILDDRTYGENKGKKIKGSELKSTIMGCINELTYRGYKEIRNRFFTYNKQTGRFEVDNQKLSKELIKEAKTSGMSQEVIYGLGLDENGEFRMPISALSSRNWIESRIISIINKAVVDINTPGGSAIQMPDFGFKKTRPVELGDFENGPFNDGKSLSFLRQDGSMEVMLTTNFFRHIVPIEHQSSFTSMRDWLFANNIIGENAEPIGVSYRIPTQGPSSTFSFVVKDVLPKTYADTIVVPDGFTAMTGADFDIDKLFIATMEYENGKKVEWDDSLPLNKQSKGALINRMIEYQQICISDDKNLSETRASIDTLTSFLKKDVLNLVKPKTLQEAEPGYELLPSFQLGRKTEYASGKAGIAPFALNSTNHALTQYAHLAMSYSPNNKKYNLGSLDAIYGEDGFRILDWLSAMINAHVDVAKDPYIITLNINKVTYNVTNFLLRGGKGLTTFYFLAQDILKLFAAKLIANEGVYGVDPTVTEQLVINGLYKEYEDRLYNSISKMPNGSKKEEFKKLYNGWVRNKAHKIKGRTFGTITDENSIIPDQTLALNAKSLQNALKLPKDSPEHLYQLLLVMKAYSELNKDAKRLASLVRISQIDTKKFGNNLALQMNFKNEVNTFINDEKTGFYLTNESTPLDMDPGEYALSKYLKSTFLNKKLLYGTSLPRQILKNQSLVATDAYYRLYNDIMRTFSGETEDDLTYKKTNDKDFVVEMNKAIESVVRARIASSIEAFNKTPEEFYNMITGPNSMCYRLTRLKQYIVENASRFPNLVDPLTATITNALLNYMLEYPADNETRTLDRIVLFNSSMNNDINTEERLISAFDDLLNSDDEYVRNFANDLAVYAYLTSYDNSGVNSFFQYVPLSWKIKVGYTEQMKLALSEFANGYATMVTESYDSPIANHFPSIALTIARNLWRNESIVPTHKLNLTNGADSILLRANSDHSNVILSIKGNDKRFIKIGSGEQAKLYRKVADIIIYNKETERPISYTRRSIYTLTPKLGTNDNGTKVYEYIDSSNKQSMFPSNAVNNDHIVNTEMLLSTLKGSELSYIKSTMNDYSKEVDKKYGMVISNVDETEINTAISEELGDIFVDPSYEDIIPMDNSILDYTQIDEVNFVDLGMMEQNSDYQIQEAFVEEANVFSDMAGLIDSKIEEFNNTSMIENVDTLSDDIFAQSEINVLLGEQIKNECKGE